MNPKNLGDIKHGLEHGLGVYAGQNNGAVFLHEAITPWMIGCGVIILLGTSLSTGLLRLWR